MPRTGSIASNVGPGGEQHALAGEHLRLRAARRARRRSPRPRACGPSPISPQAWSPLPGPRIVDAVGASCATLRCVAALAHICRFIAGATSSGQSRARHSVDSRSSAWPARAWRGSRPRPARRRSRRRRATARCGPWRCRRPTSHRSVQHRPAGQRLERHRRDEAAARLGHHDVDVDAGLDEQAREFGRLVGGDAAGDAEHDARAVAFQFIVNATNRADRREVYTAGLATFAAREHSGRSAPNARSIACTWPDGRAPARAAARARRRGALRRRAASALLLRTGVAGTSALDLARDLLARFGGSSALLAAPATAVAAVARRRPGQGAQLAAVVELARRALAEEVARAATR